jgi:arsenate reductase (thioredoxin)
MVLGFFQAIAGENAVVWSGGSEPGNQVDPSAIKVMSEPGIDIYQEFPKP